MALERVLEGPRGNLGGLRAPGGNLGRYLEVLGGTLGGPLSSLGGPLESLGRSGKVLCGPLGGHRDGLPVRLRSLRSWGDPNRQPTGNPSLEMLILAREYRCSQVHQR